MRQWSAIVPSPRPRPPAGVYSYTVSVPGGSSCVASLNVTACPPPSVTCFDSVATLPQNAAVGGTCEVALFSLSSIYTATAPSGVAPVVTVTPPLPDRLMFTPGALAGLEDKQRVGTDGAAAQERERSSASGTPMARAARADAGRTD